MSEVKSPAFQFYYKEWLTGTKSMSRVERDIYLFLLIDQFDTHNQLTCDEKELQRIAQVKTKSEKDALKYVIGKKFKPSECGKFLVNKKMNEVISALQAYKKKQAENGSNGGRPKKAVGYSGLSKTETQTEAKKSSTTTTTTTSDINTNTPNHFEHMRHFFSLPYEQQQPGFKENYSLKEYQSFQKFLTALLGEFENELRQKFDKCISIGDWKKFLKSSSYMVIRPFVVKVLGAADGDRKNMAARIATYSGDLFTEKVFVK